MSYMMLDDDRYNKPSRQSTNGKGCLYDIGLSFVDIGVNLRFNGRSLKDLGQISQYIVHNHP